MLEEWFPIINKSHEVVSSFHTLLRHLSIPLLIVVWCLVMYTTLDIIKAGITGRDSPLFTLNIIKSAADAFFYVAIAETAGVAFRKGSDRIDLMAKGTKFSIHHLQELLSKIYLIELHHVVYIYSGLMWCIVFWLSQSLIVHILVGGITGLVIIRVKDAREYPALPGSLRVTQGSQGYVHFNHTKYTSLNALIHADWIKPPTPPNTPDDRKEWEYID